MKAKLAILGLSIALAMQAAPVTIQNASFETHDPFTVVSPTFGSWNDTVVDWTAPGGFLAGQFTAVPAVLSPIATDGSIVAYILNASISQTLTALVTPGTTYTLRVDEGRAIGDPNAGYAIGLFVGSTQLASHSHPTPLGFGWITDSVTYSSPIGDPNAGQPLTIVLTSFGTETEFDNVRLDAETAPEPGSFVMLVLGAAAILGRRVRRRWAI
jgi:hypothetical protein